MKRPLSTHTFKLLFVALLLPLTFVTGFVQAQDASNDSEPATISQAQLEQILAPIALYPDTILSHILVAATYPLEVVQAERWTFKHPELQGHEAVEAATEFDWDPSVQALVAFPQILKRMSRELDWTQSLGDAFLQDEEQVLASVQNLRELAAEAGSLDDMEKVTVSRDQSSIIIEPREREVVYVPYYDTRVVYGPWRWSNYQPVYWGYPYADSYHYDDYYAHRRNRSFFWGPRISLSFGFFSNTFHWRNRHLVRISPYHYRPHRYYGHYDIIGHRHAQRWVHDSRRRHGNRNRYVSRHGHQRRDSVVVNRANTATQSERVLRQSSQERVRERLLDRRNTHIRTNNSRRVTNSQSRSQAHRNSSGDRNTARSYPSSNSRVVLPNRTSRANEQRRVVNRAPARPANRAPARPQTQARSAARPAPRPAPQRPTHRPAPPPKPVAAERRPAPNKTGATSRNQRRQPR